MNDTEWLNGCTNPERARVIWPDGRREEIKRPNSPLYQEKVAYCKEWNKTAPHSFKDTEEYNRVIADFDRRIGK
jgi:hypothetical protein